MKLAMLKTSSGTKLVGYSLDRKWVDLAAIDSDLPTTITQLLSVDDGLAKAAHALARGMSKGPFVEGELLAPISNPGKVICIGLNYRDHATETGAAIPTEPVVFNKFPEAIIGPNQNVVLPRVSHQVDYEAELVVVIGRAGKNVPEAKAWEHVAGYTIGNDISARDWQKGRPGGQWLLGKTPDTFAPLGPMFVTSDEVGDAHALNISLRLNGAVMQQSNTRELIFGIDRLIHHLSQLFTLRPGDLIFTGTPAGVGTARVPPVYLKPGDQMEVEIEGLGVLKNQVVAE